MVWEMSNLCLPSSFSSIELRVWEEMSFEEFQVGRHGGHPGYQNGIIFAILNLCVTVMPPIKIWFNPTYGLGGDVKSLPPIKYQLNQTSGLGGDVVGRISRRPPWRPSWISERNIFCNFESLCHCDASHQVLAQSDLLLGRYFKMANMVAILDIGMEQFQQF